MKILDYLKAVGVALAVLIFTMASSFPMVAVYAYFIEPGHEQEFYVNAAQWIAPWSSYLLGPIAFFLLNYWYALKNPERNTILFAVLTIIAYLILDLGIIAAIGADILMYFTLGTAFWVAVKLAGAILGAHFGRSRAGNVNSSDGVVA